MPHMLILFIFYLFLYNMISAIKKCNRGIRVYNGRQTFVQSGLSLSAADMNRMVKAGIPISAQNLSDDMLSSGHEGVDPEVPLFAKRGIDFSDVYVAQQEARSKVSNAIRAAKASQSETSNTHE